MIGLQIMSDIDQVLLNESERCKPIGRHGVFRYIILIFHAFLAWMLFFSYFHSRHKSTVSVVIVLPGAIN
jgi:hypothetical protein